MRNVTVKALLLLTVLSACEQPNVAQLLEQYWYNKAVIVVFAPSTDDAAWQEQQRALQQAQIAPEVAALIEVVSYQSVKIEGKSKAHMSTPAFYEHFDLLSSDFAIVVHDKNGDERLRQAKPLSASELQTILAPE